MSLRNWPSFCPIRLIVLLLFLEAPANHFAGSGCVMFAWAADVDEVVQPVVNPPLQASHPSDPAAPEQRSLLVEADGNPKSNLSSMVTHIQRNLSLERLPLLSPPSGRAVKHELVPVPSGQPVAKLRRDQDLTPLPAAPNLMSLLESNSSAESLLELSDAMLENASQLIHTIAQVDSMHGHRLFPNSTMTGVPRLSKLNAPALRRREEQTIKELADHSGKLQRLFEKLEHDLTTEDYGADSLDMHGPVSHAELVEDSIPDVIEEDKPTVGANLRTHPASGTAYSLLVQDQKSFRLVIVAVLVGIFFAVSMLGIVLHYRTQNEHITKPDDSESIGGSTQYVIRVHKVSVVDLPSRTALAWQISVSGENPRPSRFTNLAVWDAPVDRLDVEVAEQREKISVEVLQQSESLGPPTKIATVEIPAMVLLAEASGKKERVLSGGDEVYVHEKKLALYPRGELVIEYSLIAFFHWYVGGEGSSGKDI